MVGHSDSRIFDNFGEKGLFLSVYVNDIEMGGKEEQPETHERQLDETSGSGRTDTFVRSSFLVLHAA